jgi:glutathione S-transferase
MYTLYYSPGACSVATHIVLSELGLNVNIVDVNHVDDFKSINASGQVPVLIDGDTTLVEGAAIMLYLLDKHENTLLPTTGGGRGKAIEDIMFANATMHPAYSKLFFISQNINDDNAKQAALNAVADNINHLWAAVENKLVNSKFLGGNKPSTADIMLAVYSTWGQYFPVDITLGEKTTEMIAAVQAMPSFVKVIAAQHAESAKPL